MDVEPSGEAVPWACVGQSSREGDGFQRPGRNRSWGWERAGEDTLGDAEQGTGHTWDGQSSRCQGTRIWVPKAAVHCTTECRCFFQVRELANHSAQAEDSAADPYP